MKHSVCPRPERINAIVREDVQKKARTFCALHEHKGGATRHSNSRLVYEKRDIGERYVPEFHPRNFCDLVIDAALPRISCRQAAVFPYANCRQRLAVQHTGLPGKLALPKFGNWILCFLPH